MTKTNDIFSILDEEEMNEMSSYRKEDTGLPFIIILLGKNEQHSARIKVQQDYNPKLNASNLCSVTIADEPSVAPNHTWRLSSGDFKLVQKFVVLNKDILMDYWNLKILTRELEGKMKSIAASSEI